MQTPDLFNSGDLLASFDVFKSMRPDLTTYTEQWCAYVRYSHDLAHPKFTARRTAYRRTKRTNPHQLDLFVSPGAQYPDGAV
jgi:hypothetical protein